MKLIICLFILSACDASKKQNSTAVTDTITVKVNNSFTVELGTSMGTGYSWVLADSSWVNYLSLDSVTVKNNAEGKDDGQDLQVFHFHSHVKSNTILHFVRKRPWESNDKADKVKHITVIIE